MDPLRGHPSFYYTQWHSYLPACNMKQVFQHKRMYRAEKYHIMGNVKTSPSTVRLVPIKCFSWINTSLPSGMKKVGGTWNLYCACLISNVKEEQQMDIEGFKEQPLLLGKLEWSNVREHRQRQVFPETSNPKFRTQLRRQGRLTAYSALSFTLTLQDWVFLLLCVGMSCLRSVQTGRSGNKWQAWISSGPCSCPSQLLIFYWNKHRMAKRRASPNAVWKQTRGATVQPLW